MVRRRVAVPADTTSWRSSDLRRAHCALDATGPGCCVARLVVMDRRVMVLEVGIVLMDVLVLRRNCSGSGGGVGQVTASWLLLLMMMTCGRRTDVSAAASAWVPDEVVPPVTAATGGSDGRSRKYVHPVLLETV